MLARRHAPARPLPFRLRVFALLRHRDGLRRIQVKPIASGGLRQTDPGPPARLTLEPYRYRPPLEDFLAVAYATGWIEPFDWPAWKDRAEALVADPALLSAADAATLARLLTTHVRQVRFCDGHLAAMLRCGHPEALCARLAALLEEELAGLESEDSSWQDVPGPLGRIGSVTPQRQLVLGTSGSTLVGGLPAVQLLCLTCHADQEAHPERLAEAYCPDCRLGRVTPSG